MGHAHVLSLITAVRASVTGYDHGHQGLEQRLQTETEKKVCFKQPKSVCYNLISISKHGGAYTVLSTIK